MSDSKQNWMDKGLRLTSLTVIFSLTFIYLLFNLFNLQIIKGIEFKEKAKRVTLRQTNIPAQRGMIFDRHYDLPLVYNIDSFAVNLIPGQVNNAELGQVFTNLAKVLKLDREKITEKVKPAFYNRYQPIEIKSGVSFKTVSYIAEHIEDFKGVTWNSKPIRGYLESGSISHILGYVGEINPDELNILYNQGYSSNSTIGKTGIEKQYDDLLQGKEGKQFKIVDVTERQLAYKVPDAIPPESGKRLVLTIDRKIQRLAEKALGPRRGAVVVLRPSNGEVLALVSYPWYNAGIFYEEAGHKKYEKLSTDPDNPFINRTIQSVYPPASVFKTIISVGFIEEDVFPTDKTINCTGEYILGDRVAHCWRLYGHGPLDFLHGYEASCNVYFFTIGHDYLKIDNIVRYSRMFGLGQLTGIDLPEEKRGFVPSPEWKKEELGMDWYGGDTLNMSIGQGWTTVTPLQLSNVIAMIVNDGVIYKPHVLKEVRDPVTGELIQDPETGEVTGRVKPEIIHDVPIKKETFRKVKEAMRRVVNHGTGKLITTRVVDVAGKTGTPETGIDEFFHSWWASYGPYETDNPDERVVVTVLIEASDEERWYATRTANVIYQGIFADQTYEEAMVTLYPWLRNQFATGE